MKKLKRWIPLFVILALMSVGYFSGFYRAIDFEVVRYHHQELTEYVNNNPILTLFMFIGSYIVITALSFPVASFFTLLGGFLFPQPFCTIYVLIGATIGACLLFLAARTAFGDLLEKKAGPHLQKVKKGFDRNGTSYLLFLRFVPLVPFWLVNLAPAFLNVRLWTYIWTTFIGILPGTFAYAQAGRGLNAIFESSEKFSIQAILNPQTKIALIFLAIFALIPIFIAKWKQRKNDRS